MKLAVQYGEKVRSAARAARRRAGRLRGAAQASRSWWPTSRRTRATSTSCRTSARSSRFPLLLKDRCIGVVDLESPELDAFSKRDVEILTLLASQAAVAIENARLYKQVRANEERLEKELRFAQRVQMALLPAGPPKRLKGIEVAAAFAPARELGGDFHDYLSPESNTLVVAVGDVSGKGVPAALYSAFAAELVRGRTFRRRYLPERSSPAGVLSSVNTILQQRQLEEYYCTLCYTVFDLKRRIDDAGQLRPAVPDSLFGRDVRADRAARRAARIVPGLDLRRGDASPLHAGDVFVLCTDGVFEAMNADGQEFTAARLLDVVRTLRDLPAARVVEGIFAAVHEWRGDTPPNDDMTAVAVRITA